jgi:AmmeMemoRadiSam system protein B
MATISEVRPSPIAGTWYTANPVRLGAEMDGFIQKTQPSEIKGKIFGLVVPHAGHRYSGATAGIAYHIILGHAYPLVIILSPSHTYYPAELLSSAHLFYATPLGKIPIHREALKLLQQGLKKEGAELALVAEDEEHSIEIQLPFLQRALKGEFSILPVMMRSQSEKTVRQLSAALTAVNNKYDSLVIASSDLSHFYPVKVADALDDTMLKKIEECSPEGVLEVEQDGSGSACGAGPIAVLLTLAKQAGATWVKILQHSTSADITGDTSSVVGYGSAVIYFDHP